MPYKTFGAETLLASDVNTYLMRQGVIRLATTTDRDAIPAPEEGMQVITGTGTNMISWVYAGGAWLERWRNAGWSAAILTGGFTQTGTLQTRILGSEIQLSGTYIVRSSSTLALTAGAQSFIVAAGGVPAGHRPAVTTRFTGLVRYTSTPTAAEVIIYADGSVGVVPSVSGTLPVGSYGITIPRTSWDRP